MDEMPQPTTFLSLSFQKVVTYCTLKSFADIFYNSYLNLALFWKGTKKLTELRQKKNQPHNKTSKDLMNDLFQ